MNEHDELREMWMDDYRQWCENERREERARFEEAE